MGDGEVIVCCYDVTGFQEPSCGGWGSDYVAMMSLVSRSQFFVYMPSVLGCV